MKIGIITFWWSEDNYGQLLQCYALQKYLRDIGHKAYLIQYNPEKEIYKSRIMAKILKAINPIKLVAFIKFKLYCVSINKESAKHPRNFGEFREKHISFSEKSYSFYSELKDIPPEADIYIVGSDQVWNFNENSQKAIMNVNFLNFGCSDIKRISYAASFGKEKLEDSVVHEIAPLLKKFTFVSVREKSGLDICKQCGIDSAEWVPDPTMLLEADAYRALYEDEDIVEVNRPYCLLYLLGNEFNFSIEDIYDWARRKNVEIIYIIGNILLDTYKADKFKKNFATIPEWIHLIEHAECVITNSYHCSIFSLLFGKRFGVIPLAGKDLGMNSRFVSLFELFQTGERFLKSDFSILDKCIDHQGISALFRNMRNSCKLNDILQQS